ARLPDLRRVAARVRVDRVGALRRQRGRAGLGVDRSAGVAAGRHPDARNRRGRRVPRQDLPGVEGTTPLSRAGRRRGRRTGAAPRRIRGHAGRAALKREEFDRFADEYEALHASNVRASGEDPSFFAEYKVLDLRRLALETCVLERMRCGAILDFGGGVGNSARFLAREFPEALRLNVDVSLRSLRVARERREGGAQVAFDGATLPLASGSVDAAMCACVFHHIPEDEHVAKLAELRRVLRPGGLLMVYEHNPL